MLVRIAMVFLDLAGIPMSLRSTKTSQQRGIGCGRLHMSGWHSLGAIILANCDHEEMMKYIQRNDAMPIKDLPARTVESSKFRLRHLPIMGITLILHD
jgi:hypothetical protein